MNRSQKEERTRKKERAEIKRKLKRRLFCKLPEPCFQDTSCSETAVELWYKEQYGQLYCIEFLCTFYYLFVLFVSWLIITDNNTENRNTKIFFSPSVFQYF